MSLEKAVKTPSIRDRDISTNCRESKIFPFCLEMTALAKRTWNFCQIKFLFIKSLIINKYHDDDDYGVAKEKRRKVEFKINIIISRLATSVCR